jgi:hypothetical protein
MEKSLGGTPQNPAVGGDGSGWHRGGSANLTQADGIAHPFRVQISGLDHRNREGVFHDGRRMQGAVTLSRPGIDDYRLQIEKQGIDHGGPENRAVDPGKIGRSGFNIRGNDRFIQVMNHRPVFIEAANDRPRRDADDPHPAEFLQLIFMEKCHGHRRS